MASQACWKEGILISAILSSRVLRRLCYARWLSLPIGIIFCEYPDGAFLGYT